MGRPKPTPSATEERFWTKVTKTEACWFWSAGIHQSGYGVFRVNGKQLYAHRYSYTLHKGAIPDGLILDHVCHGEDTSCISGNRCLHRRCVRPDHLEAVPFAVNVHRGNTLAAGNAAKTHCPAAHAYNQANTALTTEGWRVCLACRRNRDRKKHAEKAAIA